MIEISEKTKKLLEEYKKWEEKEGREKKEPTIHVDEIASKVAGFYEKIRGIVDWREEHLVKRAAIERNLKRRLLLTKEKKTLAESLISELIRGGHFPNDQIEESKIVVVEKILNKYIYILENSSSSSEKRKTQLYNWLLGIAACEIEEALSYRYHEKLLIEYMMNSIANKVKIHGDENILNKISEKEKNTQLYIAIHQALFKLDSPIIIYHLLKRHYPQWAELQEEELNRISKNIYLIWDNLEKELNHPLSGKFYNLCEKYDTPYLLIGDILLQENLENIEEKILKPEIIESSIKDAYNKRFSTLRSRLYKMALYSTLSVFLTNIFSFLIIEIPLAKLITENFSFLTIAVDIGGPTLLMFLLMMTIKLPSKSNLQVVLMETMKLLYRGEGDGSGYEIKIPKKRGFIMKFFIFLFYLISAVISAGTIIFIFKIANFPITSMIINFIFVAIIAFTGLAIRNRAEELTMEEKKPGFFEFIIDIIFLPLVEIGRWFSTKWKKYNAISIIFSALIDMPFSLFIQFIEQWRGFLKEKKEKIY